MNLRVACDGEEEIGGNSIVDFIREDERGADACIIFDGGMTRPEQPEFGIATRGLVGFKMKVRTGERDLHSGYYGGAALNAIHVLAQGLSAVVAAQRSPAGPAPRRPRAAVRSWRSTASRACRPAGRSSTTPA